MKLVNAQTDIAGVQLLLNGIVPKSGDEADKVLGVTFLYFRRDGSDDPYEQDDDAKYVGFWETTAEPLEGLVHRNRSIRVVIVINIRRHSTIEKLYATLIHEWIAHARHWKAAIDAVRAGDKAKLVEIRGDEKESGERERHEHAAYAALTSAEIGQWVDLLGLEQTDSDKVKSELKKDQAAEKAALKTAT